MLRLGLVGKNGAGKTAVCDYLESQGFFVYSLSSIVRNEATKRGLDHTRDNLVSTANDLKNTKGADILAQIAVLKSELADASELVFDSIRNIDEVSFLKSQDVFMIGIDAPLEIRYQRISERRDGTDNIDLDTFKVHDDRENKGESSGQFIEKALSSCNTIIQNDGSLENLHKKIDSLIVQLRSQ